MSQGIVILGLGPGAMEQLTLEAWRILESSEEIVLRTEQHPLISHLPSALRVRSFDDLYEELPTFQAVYSAIAQEVVRLGRRPQGVVYGVPGHPWMAEATVPRIHRLAEEAHLPLRIVTGLSFVEPALSALQVDGLEGLQLLDGADLAQRLAPPVNPDHPALIGQLYSTAVASQVKLALMALYPDEHPVTLVRAAGTDEERVWQVPLYELDRQGVVDHLTSCYLPPLARWGSPQALQEIVARLRAPDGCPWDREQTHASLRSGLLEETYEVLEALDSDDAQRLKEELGDLLLQVALHQQIAVEEGEFRPPEVIGHLVDKLVRRHPHVFGELEVEGREEVLRNWESIKRQERESDGGTRTSILDGVARSLPALARAQALQDRASRVGFDWRDMAGVLGKVEEELTEFRSAQTAREQQDEIGDLLFSLVNLSRWLDVDAESTLREANDRFVARFREVEARAAEQGRTLTDYSIDELDAFWEAAKGN
jgi:tetrapyrrole methylase family protein/MazG family protein